MSPALDVEGRLERTWPFGARVYEAVQRVDVGFVANSVAFQAFGALLPLLAATFVLVALVAGEALAEGALAVTEGFLPDRTRRLLASALTEQLRSTSTSLLSVVVLLWGALNLFKGLDTAFSMVYRTRDENSLVEQTRDALVVFLALLVGLVFAVVTSSLSVLTRLPLLDYLSPLVLAVALTLVFLPMYAIFPDAHVTLRQALPGAALAGVGWTVLQALFSVYVALAGAGGGGVVGAVLLLLTWLYLGSVLLLLGAVVNAVRADTGVGAAVARESVPSPE